MRRIRARVEQEPLRAPRLAQNVVVRVAVQRSHRAARPEPRASARMVLASILRHVFSRLLFAKRRNARASSSRPPPPPRRGPRRSAAGASHRRPRPARGRATASRAARGTRWCRIPWRRARGTYPRNRASRRDGPPRTRARRARGARVRFTHREVVAERVAVVSAPAGHLQGDLHVERAQPLGTPAAQGPRVERASRAWDLECPPRGEEGGPRRARAGSGSLGRRRMRARRTTPTRRAASAGRPEARNPCVRWTRR